MKKYFIRPRAAAITFFKLSLVYFKDFKKNTKKLIQNPKKAISIYREYFLRTTCILIGVSPMEYRLDTFYVMDKLSKSEKTTLIQQLMEPWLAREEVSISLIGASRIIENPNNRITYFIDSLIDKTKNIKHVEIIARIDEDDDLLFYLNIKKKYKDVLSIRFIVGKRGGGYRKLNEIVSDNLNYLAESSKIVFGFADDCVITRKNWDVDFEKVISKYPDNIFFINTFRQFEIPYKDKYLFFFLLWIYGPPSLFSAMGRRLMDILAKEAKNHPGWTAYGNTVMCDSFLETIQMYLWELTGQKRLETITDTIFMLKDIAIAKHKEGGLFSQSPVAIDCYKDFLKDNTQAVVKKLALSVAKEMSDTQNLSECVSYA